MKIFITGIVGSGKTTLAKKWSNELHTPFYELDCIIYEGIDKNRHKRTPAQQLEVINTINERGDWIIEGTYRKSCHCLLELADQVIYLDTPLWRRILRIFFRHVKQVLHLEACHYQPSFKMLNYMYALTRDFEKNKVTFLDTFTPYKDKLLTISSNTISADKMNFH